MPLYFFYTMVEKSQKWPKTQIKGGGGPALSIMYGHRLLCVKKKFVVRQTASSGMGMRDRGGGGGGDLD